MEEGVKSGEYKETKQEGEKKKKHKQEEFVENSIV